MPSRRNHTGWLPDVPDLRDYSAETESVRRQLQRVGVADVDRVAMSESVDLRQWCSPVEDQGSLNSCSANAGVALVEFFERKAFGKHIDASRLFLYKTTRNLMGWTGDTGAFLRDTMKAMVLFGVPPERYWPYRIKRYKSEPSAFCYAFAQNYQAIEYYRLDPRGTSSDDLMNRIWANLAGGMPAMFGFTVYTSIEQAADDGRIPFPAEDDRTDGSHAVVAVGYDDNKEITNRSNDVTTTGAFLIRNSWGAGWGDGGYGWLPYDYVYRGLASDWWSLIKNEWVDTGAFTA